MKLDRRTVLAGTAAAFAAPLISAYPARADAKRQGLVDSSLESARKILTGKDYPHAAKYMQGARGAPRDWSPPAFYAMGSGSIGLQIGAKVSEVVFIIKTEKGLQAILDHKFKFGAEAGVALAVVGIAVEGASTAAGGADIIAFASSQGLFAGASLEGSYLDPDNDWNALYYGSGANTRAIVLDRRFTNPGAEPIRQFMAKW